MLIKKGKPSEREHKTVGVRKEKMVPACMDCRIKGSLIKMINQLRLIKDWRQMRQKDKVVRKKVLVDGGQMV